MIKTKTTKKSPRIDGRKRWRFTRYPPQSLHKGSHAKQRFEDMLQQSRHPRKKKEITAARWHELALLLNAAVASINERQVVRLREMRKLLDRAFEKHTAHPKRILLETFEGFVDQVINGTAHVTLKSEHGDILYGEYNANELAQQGVFERRRFICRTIAIDDEVCVELESVPETELTEAEEDAISQDVDALVAEDDLDGDY